MPTFFCSFRGNSRTFTAPRRGYGVSSTLENVCLSFVSSRRVCTASTSCSRGVKRERKHAFTHLRSLCFFHAPTISHSTVRLSPVFHFPASFYTLPAAPVLFQTPAVCSSLGSSTLYTGSCSYSRCLVSRPTSFHPDTCTP